MPKRGEPTGFGPRLKQLREAAGLSQEQLAERIGFNKFSIAKLEQGVREPTWTTVCLLIRALNVSCEAFMATPTEEPPVPMAGHGRPKKPSDAEAPAAPTKRGRKK